MRIISEKLAKINDSLSKKLVIRNSYDKAIAESQQAYSKLLENSNVLLNVLRCNQEKMKDKFIKRYSP
ncbi:Sjoegren syndrome nuclear autoantigen 1 like [Schistosoma japonicum]|nr:Sjoegren syndrome nuclear autoantigen 1 like [Schistosoma japonicum]